MNNPSLLALWWDGGLATSLAEGVLWFLLLLLARGLASDEAKRLRSLGAMIVGHLLLSLASASHDAGAMMDPLAPRGFHALQFSAQLLAVAIGVGLFNALVLGIALGRFQRSVPTVLRDVLGLVALVIGAIVLLARQGLDVKALLPTGAVLTAVIGLALQQTLGNLIGGMAIQLDKSVRVDDWVQVDGFYGRVTAIRWRSSTLETNESESVVVPNAQLLAAKLLVRGRRGGRQVPGRRWVRFRLPFSAAPAAVASLAVAAVTSEPIPHVAASPGPDCLLLSLEEGTALFALRYYLDDFVQDDATDSAVRVRLLYALRRAGFEPALPGQQVLLNTASAESRQADERARLTRREQALQGMELFAKLKPDELTALAGDLREQPFAPGEALCRQGEAADSLYLLEQGRVSVRVASDGAEREVAQLGEGAFFGEMGLMTGEPRSATVEALTHVSGLRLDKAAFQRLLTRRPELAEAIAEVLADRRVGLEQTKGQLDQATRAQRAQQHRGQLLARIREYFGKPGAGPRAHG
jgi:CRP-like cAMP-binding protein/small-conductance mechanosensitive channel